MVEAAPSSQSLPSSHRLPTVSAAEAIQKLRSVPSRNVPTGLPRLDALLARTSDAHTNGTKIDDANGLSPGHIADVYGAPGTGKTAFCLQAALSALQNEQSVIWIDCGNPIPGERIRELLNTAKSAPNEDHDEEELLSGRIERFHHYTAADLAHLLALFAYPPSDFIGDETALIVVDSLSTVFDMAYSRMNESRAQKQTEQSKWASTRKYGVMGDLVTRLQKLATVNRLVVLLTQQTRMRLRPGAGALLIPALSGVEWENGISTQLVLFRDFPPRSSSQPDSALAERWSRLRYAGLIKVNGVSAEENGRFETVVPFSIEKEGLRELPSSTVDVTVPVSSSPARASKRRFEEIADSEDEELVSDDDYGFDEDLDFEGGLTELTAMPQERDQRNDA